MSIYLQFRDRSRSFDISKAWDSDLLEENIKKDVNIFGVTGTLEIGAGGWPFVEVATISVIAEAPVSESVSLTMPDLPTVSATLSAA
jgi:hypothetical protein